MGGLYAWFETLPTIHLGVVAFLLSVPFGPSPLDAKSAGLDGRVGSSYGSSIGCNAAPCAGGQALTAPRAEAQAVGSTTSPITDPAAIAPQTVYDFSADPDGSNPSSFPNGMFTGSGEIAVIGSGWATWNPQTDGKHVLFALDGTYRVNFNSPQEAAGVKAEPNLYAFYDVTIEAFDAGGTSLGAFTLSINGFAGAAFLGLRSPTANISSIVITSAPDAGGFAFSDLTFGSSQTRHVIFVHGINGNANAIGFAGLLNRVRGEFGNDSVSAFLYYQDRAYANGSGCSGVAPPILPSAPDGGIPVHLDSVSPTICDSQSDLAINAVMLDADVHRFFNDTGEPVVLVGNSMGAAIIRGMLSYSHDHGDGVAASEVDSVFFLEGAQDGAQELVQANKNGGRGIDAQISRALLSSSWVGLNFSRPAANDELTPKSTWYRWANPNPARLPAVPYFNAFGDINIGLQPCILFWCGSFQTIVPLGDIALQTGTDDPFDTPPTGGARIPEWRGWRPELAMADGHIHRVGSRQ